VVRGFGTFVQPGDRPDTAAPDTGLDLLFRCRCAVPNRPAPRTTPRGDEGDPGLVLHANDLPDDGNESNCLFADYVLGTCAGAAEGASLRLRRDFRVSEGFSTRNQLKAATGSVTTVEMAVNSNGCTLRPTMSSNC
jgi:hypothetical protein